MNPGYRRLMKEDSDGKARPVVPAPMTPEDEAKIEETVRSLVDGPGFTVVGTQAPIVIDTGPSYAKIDAVIRDDLGSGDLLKNRTRPRRSAPPRRASTVKALREIDMARTFFPRTNDEYEVRIIQSVEEAYDTLLFARTMGTVAYDIETTGLKFEDGVKLIGFAIAWKEDIGYYFPLDHNYENVQDVPLPKNSTWSGQGLVSSTDFVNLPFNDPYLRLAIQDFLTDPGVKKVGSNIKFDYHGSEAFFGVKMRNIGDIGFLARIRRSYQRVGLKELMQTELDRFPWEEEALKEGLKTLRFKFPGQLDNLPIITIGTYNIADVIYTLKLWNRFLEEINTVGEKRLIAMEEALIPVLAQMEDLGMPIDEPYLENLLGEFQAEQQELKSKIQDSAGFELNPNSAMQLRAYLFDTKTQKVGPVMVKGGLGLKPIKMTGGGVNEDAKPATDEDTLKQLEGESEIIPYLLRFRELSKLVGTYLEGKAGILKNAKGGRVLGEISQDAARSSRLAGRNPNLMTIPKRKGPAIRKGFVANAPGEEGYHLALFDADQIEFRIFAHYTRNPELIRLVWEGVDFHDITASYMWDHPLDSVPKEAREDGKKLNYTMMFMGGIGQIMMQMKVDKKEAYALYNRYHTKFPFMRQYQEDVEAALAETGRVRTIFGHSREYPWWLRSSAGNHPIQGTAAGILKYATVRSANQLEGMKSEILMLIHDELYCRWHESEDMFNFVATINDAMTSFLKDDDPLGDSWKYPGSPLFRIPLTVGLKTSDTSWAATKDVDVGELFLKSDWEKHQEWLKKVCGSLGTDSKGVLLWLSRNNKALCRSLMDTTKTTSRAYRFHQNMLDWKGTLSRFRSAWSGAARAYSAR